MGGGLLIDGIINRGTTVLNFIYLDSLLLYLNLCVFRRKILVVRIISPVKLVWPKAYISENNSFLVPMIKDKGHSFLM
jgi:hypothetical protein